PLDARICVPEGMILTPMAQSCHILSLGYDRSLLASRTMVMQSAGFTVDEAYSVADVLRLVCDDSVEILVICHTVPLNEQEQLIPALREVRELLPVICIAASECEVGKDVWADVSTCRILRLPSSNAVRSIMIRDDPSRTRFTSRKKAASY